jgi:RNA polymerase sigma-70 factor (ECF subfamily)
VRPTPDHRTDADLVGRGDAESFTEIYDRHAPTVYAWSRARVGDYAADLTAEVFAQAWRSRHKFNDRAGGSALPWLLGIAQNVLRSSIRKRRVEQSARERLGLPVTIAQEDEFEGVEERLSFPTAVSEAFANLPEAERELLVLRLVENRPYLEIAQRMGCTPVAARLRFSRLVRQLRVDLGGQL